jgi:hypothetical protein
MEATSAKTLSFAGSVAHQEAGAWITAYTLDVLAAKDGATIEAYTRTLKRFAVWLSARPGNHDRFHPQAITHTAIGFSLDTLPSSSYKTTSISTTSVTILRIEHESVAGSWKRWPYYLGYITKSGMPAIQTTIRYTQVSCEHVKEKLKLLRG